MQDSQIAALGAKLDAVIDLSKRRLAEAPEPPNGDCYRTILKNFEGLRMSLHQGYLSRHFATGAGFGASRALSRWDLGDDGMSRAVLDAEEFYRRGG